MAGLGIRDPVQSSKHAFETSVKATVMLSDAIVNTGKIDIDIYERSLCAVTAEMKKVKEDNDRSQLEEMIDLLPNNTSRKVRRILESKCSTWLSIVPTTDNHFALSPDEFRDALSVRYLFSPKRIPDTCDGCGEHFDLTHALNCKKGGLVTARHNEARDLNCDLCTLAGLHQIISEPVLQEPSDDQPGLRADWKVRGFWEVQRDALFDICIFNADASSLNNQNLQTIFDARKRLKKEKYSAIAAAKRASFTPIIATCEAIFDKEAEVYMKRLATLLSKKWKSCYSRAVCYIRARMQICIHRSVSLCIRGSRTKWRGAGIIDSAAIPMNILDLD